MTNETVETAKRELRAAETRVAQLTGEERALEAQAKASAEKLLSLGIQPEQAAGALEALEAEYARIEADLVVATAALEQAMVAA